MARGLLRVLQEPRTFQGVLERSPSEVKEATKILFLITLQFPSSEAPSQLGFHLVLVTSCHRPAYPRLRKECYWVIPSLLISDQVSHPWIFMYRRPWPAFTKIPLRLVQQECSYPWWCLLLAIVHFLTPSLCPLAINQSPTIFWV